MDRINLTIDVSKIDKTKIIQRKYTKKDGTGVTTQDLKLDIIPKREPRLVKSGDTWEMWETHFVAEAQTKDEREQKVKSNIIGSGTMFKTKVQEGVDTEPVDTPSDTPF